MKTLAPSRYALTIGVAAALLAGCGGSQLPVGAPDAQPQTAPLAARTNGTQYKVVYSFGAIPDGNTPLAGLIHLGGTLYGTTEYGGANACGQTGCGTVFGITTAGTEQVLYSFGSRPDGNYPYAGLTDVAGTLYGTTRNGGAYGCGDYGNGSGCGVVYSVTTSGEENVQYSFGWNDGHYPVASLIAVKGTLYGTTRGGTRHRYGTVFSITTSGAENVLHTFNKEQGRGGSFPTAALTDIKGTLYGTTSQGGAHGDGVVFSITPSGTQKVLHSFDGTDGANPAASLVNVKGTLYGTTASGGAYGGGPKYCCGTVFSITPGGIEKVLYSFSGGSDGADPIAPLIDVHGMLYGTTLRGGSRSCRLRFFPKGCGTVFSVTTEGAEKVLHIFGSGTDGTRPTASLTYVDGTLYGTTSTGGRYGYGTVFALTLAAKAGSPTPRSQRH
jgi:uncharacterized repeat protein (TIGR03803 family)